MARLSFILKYSNNLISFRVGVRSFPTKDRTQPDQCCTEHHQRAGFRNRNGWGNHHARQEFNVIEDSEPVARTKEVMKIYELVNDVGRELMPLADLIASMHEVPNGL